MAPVRDRGHLRGKPRRRRLRSSRYREASLRSPRSRPVRGRPGRTRPPTVRQGPHGSGSSTRSARTGDVELRDGHSRRSRSRSDRCRASDARAAASRRSVGDRCDPLARVGYRSRLTDEQRAAVDRTSRLIRTPIRGRAGHGVLRRRWYRVDRVRRSLPAALAAAHANGGEVSLRPFDDARGDIGDLLGSQARAPLHARASTNSRRRTTCLHAAALRLRDRGAALGRASSG